MADDPTTTQEREETKRKMPVGRRFKKGQGGRPKGTPNKRTRALQLRVAQSGEMPVEIMLKFARGQPVTYRDDKGKRRTYYPSIADIQWGAERAAPYLHARLAAIEHKGDVTHRHEDFIDKLASVPPRNDNVVAFPAKSGA